MTFPMQVESNVFGWHMSVHLGWIVSRDGFSDEGNDTPSMCVSVNVNFPLAAIMFESGL
jgi:hypothetical protein